MAVRLTTELALPVAGQNFNLNGPLTYPVELFHALFDIAQVKDLPLKPGKVIFNVRSGTPSRRMC